MKTTPTTTTDELAHSTTLARTTRDHSCTTKGSNSEKCDESLDTNRNVRHKNIEGERGYKSS